MSVIKLFDHQVDALSKTAQLNKVAFYHDM